MYFLEKVPHGIDSAKYAHKLEKGQYDGLLINVQENSKRVKAYPEKADSKKVRGHDVTGNYWTDELKLPYTNTA